MNAETTTKQLPIDKVHESPFNRRRAWGKLDELAASIKKVGLLEELLARPHPSRKGEYELVFGHRRLRAAKLAELDAVPSKVRLMSDEAVLDAQIIENLQREDVHPLDEAETYEQHIASGKTATEIAARVGKHPSYVHQRLRLLTLCEDVRAAYADDRITTAVAILIARLPSQTAQIEALEDVAATEYEPARTLAEARQIIESSFLLRLAEAPFDRTECARCPKRTGNQPELFADVNNADTCTDRGCFDAKKAAHFEGLLADAKKRGLPVLTGKEAVRQIDSARWSQASEYIDLDAEVHTDDDEDLEEYDDDFDDDSPPRDKPRAEPPPRKTYRELLAGAALDVTIAQELSGKIHELVPRDLVATILPSEKPKGGRLHAPVDYAKEQREKAAKQRARTLAIIGAIVEKAGANAAAEEGFWHFLGHLLIGSAHHDTRAEICKRRGLEVPMTKQYGGSKRYDYDEALGVACSNMKPAERKALCIELIVSRTAYFSHGEGLTDALKLAIGHYKIDVKKVVAAAKQAAKKPAKKAAKKAATPAKKSAAKKGAVRRG